MNSRLGYFEENNSPELTKIFNQELTLNIDVFMILEFIIYQRNFIQLGLVPYEIPFPDMLLCTTTGLNQELIDLEFYTWYGQTFSISYGNFLTLVGIILITREMDFHSSM